MSRARAQLKRDAEKMLLAQTLEGTPRWITFLVRHPRIRRLAPKWLTQRRMEAIEEASFAAEQALPRRYRRALRGQAMRPAKETR